MKVPNTKISKVLVANRGEIALRIKRAAESLGIQAVGVASEVDKNAFFARQFKELVALGGSTAQESYLNVSKLLAAAKGAGCDAVHPGYGFLSENADFATAVRDAGLIFVGPSQESIRILGDKTKARQRVQEFKVPCVPGCEGGLSDEQIVKAIKAIGYPVIIKAAGGGGGRGMRIAHSDQELREQLPRARGESKKNFGNDDVFVERYIINPRHVEVQLMGDMHGEVLHFGTRDCTAQRRHQKLLEEAPAPNLPDIFRESIHQAAVNAAKSVGYYNAGTAEFLVSGDSFYFLEMNTRIQVEHPISEEITGVDLVALQFKVAQGEKLPLTQSEIKFRGHAIEFRVCAEDPEKNFAPATGKIAEMRWKKSLPYIREESGFAEGDVISPYYDGMLSKIIVKGANREEAIERGYLALKELSIKGIKHNLEFQRWLLLQPKFRKVQHSIQYIESEFKAEDIARLRSRETKDPRHIEAINGAEYVERRVLWNEIEKAGRLVEIVHKADGTFLGIPLDADGRPLEIAKWRRSNTLDCLLRSKELT